MIHIKMTIQNGLGLFLLATIPLFTAVPIARSQGEMPDEPGLREVAKEKAAPQIKPEVDPGFLYHFEKTRFVPPDGKTLLIMGQTVEGIEEYKAHFPEQRTPGGWSTYWGVPEFKGITDSHKNTVGNTQNHQMLVDSFPNTVIQSAMWMVGTWEVAKNTASGAFDEVIKQYGAWAKTADRPIYLRIGYEFDGPHNELEPDEYIAAYRRVVDLLRKDSVGNIAYVWHSYAARPYKDYPLSAWYPGDDYVDWVGISVFGHAYGDTDFGAYCDTVLDFARHHKKPVMIAESNPVYGIDQESDDVWDQWFVPFFNFIYSKNIKAVSFINEDWGRMAMGGISEWKDARLYNNQKVSKAWFDEVNKDRYLKQSAELFEQLGFSGR